MLTTKKPLNIRTKFPMPNVRLNQTLEVIFRFGIVLAGIAVVMILLGVLYTLLMQSLPSIREFGFGFLWGKTWDPYSGVFGALPFFVGTFLTALVALLICIPISLALAIFMGEYLKDGWISTILKGVIEILAGIPSVIYGFWALYVMVPWVQSLQTSMNVIPYGVGIFSASLILSIMIIPYSASLGREVVSMVPSDLKEAALSLGSTRYEMVKYVILPYARSGLMSGVFLSFGRAIGETMAVTMVIGNCNFMPMSLFSPANTMASVLANEFGEATDKLYMSSLIEMALVLFVATTILSFIGRAIIKRWKV